MPLDGHRRVLIVTGVVVALWMGACDDNHPNNSRHFSDTCGVGGVTCALPDAGSDIVATEDAMEGEPDGCAVESSCGACGVVCAADEICSADQCQRLSRKRLLAGGDASCLVRGEGGNYAMWCWGGNEAGEAGSPDVVTDTPRPLDGPPVVTGSIGESHSCGIDGQGRVWCRGNNTMGVLGDLELPSGPEPVQIPRVRDAVELDSGFWQACARLVTGQVMCWGDIPFLADDEAPGPEPTVLEGIDDAVAIAVGFGHGCAIVGNGEVACWGSNQGGELGVGPEPRNASVLPLAVEGVTNAISIDAVWSRTCVATDRGEVWCWGTPLLRSGRQLATRLEGIDDAVSVVVGQHHVCALRTTGTVVCVGGRGRLGHGRYEESSSPVTVVGVSDVVELAAGDSHTCALGRDGSVWCWGNNNQGQLGDAAVTERTASPVALVETDVVQPGYQHSCAIRRNDSRALCWGSNERGQLGDGTFFDHLEPRETVNLLGSAQDVKVGWSFSCALLTSGRVECWGANDEGQLGNGSFDDSPVPVEVLDVDDAISLAVGNHHACVVRAAGEVVCWGRNEGFALGTEEGDHSAVPVAVDGVTDAVTIAAGGDHTCVRHTDQTVSCWGANAFDQLGTDEPNNRSAVPLLVAGLTEVSSLHLGTFHSCVRLASGEPRCWGNNNTGQVGNPEVGNTHELQPVAMLGSTRALAAGSYHTCAADQSGQVVCWGNNVHALVELGGERYFRIPVEVPGLIDGVSIAAGERTTCAKLGDGSWTCWGGNGFGTIGSGTTLGWRNFATRARGLP